MRRPAALVVLAAALLAGCSSEAAEPEALPEVAASASAAVSPSESPEATTAPVPPAAQDPTPEGAAAFARFFYAEVMRAYVEKDPNIVAGLSAPECVACDRFVDSLTALRDDGETVTPVVYEIISAEVPEVAVDGSAVVEVIYDSPEIIRKDRSGTVIQTEPNVVGYQEQVTLQMSDSGWLVQRVAAV